jgi:hypothetical protein
MIEHKYLYWLSNNIWHHNFAHILDLERWKLVPPCDVCSKSFRSAYKSQIWDPTISLWIIRKPYHKEQWAKPTFGIPDLKICLPEVSESHWLERETSLFFIFERLLNYYIVLLLPLRSCTILYFYNCIAWIPPSHYGYQMNKIMYNFRNNLFSLKTRMNLAIDSQLPFTRLHPASG